MHTRNAKIIYNHTSQFSAQYMNIILTFLWLRFYALCMSSFGERAVCESVAIPGKCFEAKPYQTDFLLHLLQGGVRWSCPSKTMQNLKCWLRFLTWWNCKTRGGQSPLAATANINPIWQGFANFEDQVKTYIKCAWIFWWSYQASGWLTQCSLMCAVHSVTLKSWAGIEWM